MENHNQCPHIWLYNLCLQDLVSQNELNAKIDFSGDYFTYSELSAGIMSEYNAVVWRTNSPTREDNNRTNQLSKYIEEKNGVFVFFLDKYQHQKPYSTISVIKNFLEKNLNESIGYLYNLKISRKFELTSEGQISPFREYLEYEPQLSYVSFNPNDNIIPLAINRDSEPIAFTLSNYKFYIYFLPAPKDSNHIILFIKNLLEAVNRVVTISEESPTWTNFYTIPGEKKLKEKLNLVLKNIKELEIESKKHKEKLDELIWLKDTLLSKDGKNLENAVKYVLKEFGFKPKFGQIGQEDITFKSASYLFLAEIKGATSSASEANIKQLHSKLTLYHEKEKVETKGILLINPWRQFPPDERNSKERTIFPDAILSLVNIWRLCLVTTTQLLEAYRQYLTNKLDVKKFAEELHNTIGILKNYHLKKQ